MCLSTVFKVSGGKHQEVMQDVARMEAHDDGFLLINLFGEQKFVQGRVKRLDFVDEHSVVLEESANRP